jgi:hypothetical protein
MNDTTNSPEAQLAEAMSHCGPLRLLDGHETTYVSGFDMHKAIEVLSQHFSDVKERQLSLSDLVEAALLTLERVDTVKLAALGRDADAVAVSDTRRLLDHMKREGRKLK